MNNNESVKLINFLITKTKSSEIKWDSYTNYSLKPLPSSTKALSFSEITSNVILGSMSSISEGYACSIDKAQFFLLLHNDGLLNNKLVLRVQMDNVSYSKIYASSDETLEIASQLKRLYNLVENSVKTPELDSYIKSLIDDE